MIHSLGLGAIDMRVARRRSGWALGLILAVAIGAPAVGASDIAARAAEIPSLLAAAEPGKD